jgi:two-component system, chemotaxis family, protein-glutamate methylesterase/glutaminase
MEPPLRVLIVDDTVTYRKIVSDALSGCPGVEVVGTAANGKIAMQRLQHLSADLMVLDLEMPEMNGQAVLEELRRQNSSTGAIMLSAFTAQGAKSTLRALEAGAFDFVLKPGNGAMAANVQQLRRELQTKIAAYRRQRSVKEILYGENRAASATAIAPPPRAPRVVASPAGPPLVAAIGISTGGPKALAEMLPQLPSTLPVPVLIVQHMPPVFTKSLADDLNGRCKLPVREGCDGQAIQAGEVWIAPGGRQMKVCRNGESIVLRITHDPPENSCRPSVDYLFRSVAEVYGGRCVGVIMTGMGNDGTVGCQRLKHCGASIIVQDEATCVVFGMPREPIEKGIVDVVAPLGQIAAEITRFCRLGAVPCK